MKKVIYVIVCSLLLLSCGSNNQNAETEVDQLAVIREEINKNEKLIFDKTIGEEAKRNKVILLRDMYRDYATNNPLDDWTPEYLFRLAQVHISLNDFDASLSTLAQIERDFKGHKRHIESIYLSGFIYDNYLNQKGKASQYYEKVIALYPTHALAADAKQSIELLNVSDEELIERLQKGEGV